MTEGAVDDRNTRTEPPIKGQAFAVVAMIGACALLGVTTLLAKVLGLGTSGEQLHPLQVSAGRFFFAWLLIGAVALYVRPTFIGTAWHLHAARSVFGWLGVTCMFAAAAKIPLSDATALSFLSPLVTLALAGLMLGERPGIWRWSAVAISLIGALVLIRPGTDAFQIAALIALAAAAFMGLESIFIKRLSNSEPALRILLINNTIGAVVSVNAAFFFWTMPTTTDWALLATLGVAMAGAQAMVIQAMKRGDASTVTPLLYSTLVFVTLYDFIVFGTLPDALGLIGAALIVVGALIISLRGNAKRASA